VMKRSDVQRGLSSLFTNARGAGFGTAARSAGLRLHQVW
jgi:hypothetical protein